MTKKKEAEYVMYEKINKSVAKYAALKLFSKIMVSQQQIILKSDFLFSFYNKNWQKKTDQSILFC